MSVSVNPSINGGDGSSLNAAQNTAVAALFKAQSNLLPRYRAALAATAAGTADTIIAYAGDSTVAGAYSAGVTWAGCRTLSPPVLLGNYLAANLGLPVSQDATFGQASGSTPQHAYDPRVTFTNWTGLNDGNVLGLGGACFRDDTAEVASVALQGAQTCDTIKVVYLTNSSGATADVLADGVNVGNFNYTGSLALASSTFTCMRGVHNVAIQRRVGAGFFLVFAIILSDSTTRRVQVWNWGAGGTTINNWNDQSATYGIGYQGPALAPHLLLLQLGVNDAIGGTTTNANALTYYQNLIDLYRPTSDIVVVTPTPVALAQATLAQQRAIYTAVRTIAQQNGCPIIDNNALFGTYLSAAAAGYYLPAADQVHPGPNGYAAMATNAQALPGLLRGL